jgi:hypothetical protein
MTVVRIEDGSLLLHSPIALSSRLRSQIDCLGPVRHIVSPNKLHHLFLNAAVAAYPGARLYVPPGLIEKRPEFARGEHLTDVPPSAWVGTLEQIVVRGSNIMQEVAFFHPRSRTLIVADLCENFGRHGRLLTCLLARLARMYNRPRMQPDW